MATAGLPVVPGIPAVFTPLQLQAQAKLLPGGVYGPVAMSSTAKHDEMALCQKKIETHENKIRTDPTYGAGSLHQARFGCQGG